MGRLTLSETVRKITTFTCFPSIYKLFSLTAAKKYLYLNSDVSSSDG